jgi:hypothetical protein
MIVFQGVERELAAIPYPWFLQPKNIFAKPAGIIVSLAIIPAGCLFRHLHFDFSCFRH